MTITYFSLTPAGHLHWSVDIDWFSRRCSIPYQTRCIYATNMSSICQWRQTQSRTHWIHGRIRFNWLSLALLWRIPDGLESVENVLIDQRHSTFSRSFLDDPPPIGGVHFDIEYFVFLYRCMYNGTFRWARSVLHNLHILTYVHLRQRILPMWLWGYSGNALSAVCSTNK